MTETIDRANGEEEIRRVLERFRSGWEALNIPAVLSTFSNRSDLVVYGTDRAEKWVGYESLVEDFNAQADAYSDPLYVWEEGPDVWTRGDVGWACGNLSVSLTTENERVTFPMRCTVVLEKDPSGWAIVHGHFSVGFEESVAPYS